MALELETFFPLEPRAFLQISCFRKFIFPVADSVTTLLFVLPARLGY